jgi:hypothetical protein
VPGQSPAASQFYDPQLSSAADGRKVSHLEVIHAGNTASSIAKHQPAFN